MWVFKCQVKSFTSYSEFKSDHFFYFYFNVCQNRVRLMNHQIWYIILVMCFQKEQVLNSESEIKLGSVKTRKRLCFKMIVCLTKWNLTCGAQQYYWSFLYQINWTCHSEYQSVCNIIGFIVIFIGFFLFIVADLTSE